MSERKEKITFTAVEQDGGERELTIEYSQVGDNEGCINVYWELLYEGEPEKDRYLFSCDYQGNFEDIINRMKQLWSINNERFNN